MHNSDSRVLILSKIYYLSEFAKSVCISVFIQMLPCILAGIYATSDNQVE